jgi:hypothetical protein
VNIRIAAGVGNCSQAVLKLMSGIPVDKDDIQRKRHISLNQTGES